MKVPLDLQPCIGKKELCASLRTGYTAEAHSKARLIAGRVQQLFIKIRISARDNNNMTKIDQAKLKKIIRGIIRDSLDEEEDIRINRQRPISRDDVSKRAEFLSFLQAGPTEGARPHHVLDTGSHFWVGNEKRL